MGQPKFCLLCGAALIRRVPPCDSKERDACSRCDYVYYPQPKVAAGKVVLIKRGVEPGYGKTEAEHQTKTGGDSMTSSSPIGDRALCRFCFKQNWQSFLLDHQTKTGRDSVTSSSRI